MGFQLPISTGATAHPAHPAHPPLLKPPSTWSVRLTKSMMGKRNGLGPRPLGWVNGSCGGFVIPNSVHKLVGNAWNSRVRGVNKYMTPGPKHHAFFWKSPRFTIHLWCLITLEPVIYWPLLLAGWYFATLLMLIFPLKTSSMVYLPTFTRI